MKKPLVRHAVNIKYKCIQQKQRETDRERDRKGERGESKNLNT